VVIATEMISEGYELIGESSDHHPRLALALTDMEITTVFHSLSFLHIMRMSGYFVRRQQQVF
jgi:hypothetical protein